MHDSPISMVMGFVRFYPPARKCPITKLNALQREAIILFVLKLDRSACRFADWFGNLYAYTVVQNVTQRTTEVIA